MRGFHVGESRCVSRGETTHHLVTNTLSLEHRKASVVPQPPVTAVAPLFRQAPSRPTPFRESFQSVQLTLPRLSVQSAARFVFRSYSLFSAVHVLRLKAKSTSNKATFMVVVMTSVEVRSTTTGVNDPRAKNASPANPTSLNEKYFVCYFLSTRPWTFHVHRSRKVSTNACSFAGKTPSYRGARPFLRDSKRQRVQSLTRPRHLPPFPVRRRSSLPPLRQAG